MQAGIHRLCLKAIVAMQVAARWDTALLDRACSHRPDAAIDVALQMHPQKQKTGIVDAGSLPVRARMQGMRGDLMHDMLCGFDSP